MIYNKTIQAFGRVVGEAVDVARQRMKDGDIDDEPTLTGAFTEILRSRINETLKLEDYSFRAKVYRGIGPDAPENKIGADLCGIVNISSSEESVSKGFLMQAKWAERNGVTVSTSRMWHHTPTFSINNNFRDLQAQCDKMLNVTPDSYVLLYSVNGFTVIPASSIVAITKPKGKFQIYSKHVPGFFKEFFMSFIGDIRIKSPELEDLERIRIENLANYILEIDVERQE